MRKKYIAAFFFFLAMVFCIYPIISIQIISPKAQQVITNDFLENFELDQDGRPTNSVSIGGSSLVTLGVLYIPDIGLTLPIYEGTSHTAISEGSGIIEGSGDLSYTLGMNTIITSHNGMPGKNLFMKLEQLEVGDSFYRFCKRENPRF